MGSNPNIVIKKADKGGGICVLAKGIYEQKVYELLSDRNTYKLLQNDPTKSVIRDVNNLIDYMKCHHIVDEKTANFLRPKIPHRSPLFYGLPKIHKTHIPLRPIVSRCDRPTDNLSKFITYFIQPLAQSLPSYFKETTHFLNMLQSQRIASRSCIFVKADVTSLYTNIPHREGIDEVKYYTKQIPLSARM